MNLQRFTLGIASVMVAGVLGAGSGLGAQVPARRLEMSFNNGNITIVAENVTLRDIMIEWGRKGGSRMVNADKLGGASIPYIEFTNQPEVTVLRSLLRDVPGYGAAPRPAPEAGASSFASVFIVASRTVPVSAAPAQSTSQAPQPLQDPVEDEDMRSRLVGDDGPPGRVPGAPTETDPSLRVGPGGVVTSTIPGVVIPSRPDPTIPPSAPGRGRGGGSL